MSLFERMSVWLGQSRFAKDVATLAGGQGLALAIPILAAPLLGRLYTPSDYGLLAGFMGFNIIFATIGNWQYALAIPVQRTERRAIGLLAVAVWASALSSLLAFAVVVGVIPLIKDQPSLEPISTWLWVLPITTLGVGVSGALSGFANRRRNYKLMSAVTIASVVSSSSIAIGFGLLGLGIAGLLFSYIVGQLVGLVVYGWKFKDALFKVRRFPPVRVLALARAHSTFPRYSLPASVFRSIAMATPSFALLSMNAADLAGHFSRALSLLALPLGLVGTAIAQVFQEKAARERAETGSCWSTYKAILMALAIASPPGFALLAIAAPDLFTFYLGKHWGDTGYVAQLLAPMMCLRMIAGPLWPVFAIFNHNHRDFWIALWQLTATLALSLLFFGLGLPALWQIIAFALVTSSVSLLHLAQTYRLVRADSGRSK